ncbi:hypothetical protein B7494_g5122 [Chlorociboria aeruginascens]|nr:hypothetical protein B7494_g5122 [Chlorociboria aeruginascens]
MASSRIFVKGLPPTISEDEFKKHFSAIHTVTDAKLIPHRRIGYVGYGSPEEAARAVKYFNRSFIRMSKIGVEIARPISDTTLPVSRKAQREQERGNAKTAKIKDREGTKAATLNIGIKRKRSDIDEADPKLREFLEVMQPTSHSKSWATEAIDDSISEPPTKIQAIEAPEKESDREYEAAPKKSRKESPPKATLREQASIGVPAGGESAPIDHDVELPSGPDATDDDWLRSRTSRLLDLVPPEDIPTSKGPLDRDTPDHIVSEALEEEFRPLPNNGSQQNNEEIVEDTEEYVDPVIKEIKTNGRLFVRNLSYTASEQDLRAHFEPYGLLEEVSAQAPYIIYIILVMLHDEYPDRDSLCFRACDVNWSIILVDASYFLKALNIRLNFIIVYDETDAYSYSDGEPFQGRLLHILPAAAKRENKLDEFAIAKLPLKKQRQIKKKAGASSTSFNWNFLYMSQDAVNSSVADRLGVSKSEILDPTSADASVKQAIAETSVIHDTKSYFAKNGVDLDAFKRHERGDTAILVKNFPYGMTLEELRKMFEVFGQVLRVLMPPTGTIAIVEFAQPSHARAAFANLAYRRMKDSVLFLEKAPKDLFIDVSNKETVVPSDRRGGRPGKFSTSDLLEGENVAEEIDTSTLFVRNLNFATTSERLAEMFRPLDGFLSARVNTKINPKKPGQVLSMGFGFLEFRSKSQAQAALKAMDGYNLDDHKLLIKTSHRGVDAAEDRKKEDRAKKMAGKRTKIIIKNLPFEASKKDIRSLFGTYGQLRSVRVPKKFDHSTRGFAFADFITAREAENALESLKNTHLLGRRLVLEFAFDDPVDAEEEIEKMQKKVGSQVNKVTLQKLTGGGRKKFNIEGNDGDED